MNAHRSFACINPDLGIIQILINNSMNKQTGISIHWNITQHKNEWMLQDSLKIILLSERSHIPLKRMDTVLFHLYKFLGCGK